MFHWLISNGFVFLNDLTDQASRSGTEGAVEVRDNVVHVVAVDEALRTVVYEPAIDVCAVPFVAPVVLLPAPDRHTDTHVNTISAEVHFL